MEDAGRGFGVQSSPGNPQSTDGGARLVRPAPVCYHGADILH